jgi:alpha-ketoglutarate-dependent 2,4-dichlorophenoxyacetate dioxygenase
MNTLSFQRLAPSFFALAGPVDLRTVHDAARLTQIRDAMDEHAVLLFRNQPFTDAEQLAFAQRLDGELHARTSSAAIAPNRFGNEALTDISNVNAAGEIVAADDRKRMGGLANRLWHTDASFEDPAGRYSMLSARVVPPVRADTEFADMRAAWDALETDAQSRLQELRVHHSIVHSRQTLGFEFSAEERARLPGAEHPLVLTHPRTGRRSLYLASHAERIVGQPVPEGRLLLQDLMEHATQPRFRWQHLWQAHDFIIWDNRSTMHRARPFDDRRYRREMRRTTTLDLPFIITGA